MLSWSRLYFISDISVLTWALAGSAQTELTSALAVLAAIPSPLQETQPSSCASWWGDLVFLKGTGFNSHCNWKLLIQNNTGTLLVPWEYVSPVCSSPCSCERSQRAQLRAPACARRRCMRACMSSHRANIPTAGPRCEESSCFPLLFGGTPWVSTNPFQRPNAEYQGALQLLLFFHPNRSKDNLSQQGPLT